jgi:NTP pyrophosphatase (non-canonical NTP hydrolase)
LADILIYTLRLASQMEIDLGSAAWAKLEKNRHRYPVEKARGTARKYTEL